MKKEENDQHRNINIDNENNIEGNENNVENINDSVIMKMIMSMKEISMKKMK